MAFRQFVVTVRRTGFLGGHDVPPQHVNNWLSDDHKREEIFAARRAFFATQPEPVEAFLESHTQGGSRHDENELLLESKIFPNFEADIASTKGCDVKTLAVIAAQFIARGDDEQEALRKANVLFLKASAYAKWFASLPPAEKAFEVDPERALSEAAESFYLAIGDSEANSPALAHFWATATTKLDQSVGHKKFLEIVKHHYGQKVEEVAPSGEKSQRIKLPVRLSPGRIEHLHILLRHSRSRKRAKRREKNPVKENRTKRGV